MKPHFASKLIASILLLFFISFSTFAQESMIQRVDVAVQKNNQFSLYLEGGFTFPYTDVQKPQTGKVAGLGLSYSPLSYIQVVFNFQRGYLMEGRAEKPYGRMHYSNRFYYTGILGRLSPLKIFKRPDEGIVKYLDAYVGGGMGLIFSNVHASQINESTYGYIDNYTGADFMIPYEIGYTIPVYTFKEKKQEVSLNINYRSHLSFTDKLDGYEPTVTANQSNDLFNQITFGLVFSF